MFKFCVVKLKLFKIYVIIAIALQSGESLHILFRTMQSSFSISNEEGPELPFIELMRMYKLSSNWSYDEIVLALI